MTDTTPPATPEPNRPPDRDRPPGVSRRTAVIGMVVAVAIGAFLVIGLRNESGPIREIRLDGTEPAPDIVGKDLKTGRSVSLAEFRGKPVFINAWASWCMPCRNEAPHFVELTQKHPEIQMLGLNMNSRRVDALHFLGESGWTYPSIVDEDGKIGMDKLAINNLPTTIYVDAKGIIRGRSPGEITMQEIESVAERITQPAPAPTATTAASR